MGRGAVHRGGPLPRLRVRACARACARARVLGVFLFLVPQLNGWVLTVS